MSEVAVREARCAYCIKALEIGERLVMIAPNRPIRRVLRSTDADLPNDCLGIHERCYDERDNFPRHEVSL